MEDYPARYCLFSHIRYSPSLLSLYYNIIYIVKVYISLLSYLDGCSCVGMHKIEDDVFPRERSRTHDPPTAAYAAVVVVFSTYCITSCLWNNNKNNIRVQFHSQLEEYARTLATLVEVLEHILSASVARCPRYSPWIVYCVIVVVDPIFSSSIFSPPRTVFQFMMSA